MQFKDYYQVLGVARDADPTEIKKAYRQKARRYHPDVYTGTDAEDRFKDINEAYQVLSDPEKRSKYDHFGTDWVRYQSAPEAGNADFTEWFTGAAGDQAQYEFHTASGGSGFSDFFDLLFGSEGFGQPRRSSGGRTGIRPRPVRGDDHEYPVELSLAEAFNGTRRTFEIATNEPNQAPSRQKIEVTIPAGVRDGSRVRVAGKGGPGRNGGPAGDVYLRVRLKKDTRFSLEDGQLRSEVEVPLYTALLGGEVIVPLLSGKRIAVTVPAETQNGQTMRLKGQGWPVKPGATGRGDLVIKFKVVLPQGLSDEERELLEHLASLRTDGQTSAKVAA